MWVHPDVSRRPLSPLQRKPNTSDVFDSSHPIERTKERPVEIISATEVI